MNVAQQFQEAVVERLNELGITQRELADRLGITAATVSQKLSADELSTATLDRFAEALGIEFDVLYTEVAERKTSTSSRK